MLLKQRQIIASSLYINVNYLNKLITNSDNYQIYTNKEMKIEICKNKPTSIWKFIKLFNKSNKYFKIAYLTKYSIFNKYFDINLLYKI